MKTIAHLSDLHFGVIDRKIAERLRYDLLDHQPDVVVVSGDVTQRARARQFKAAKAYLEQIPFDKVIVPGNHDIPLFDVWRRFLAPLKRYRTYICSDVNPMYMANNELAIYGVNTARSLTWKEGRISAEQIQDMEKKLCALPQTVFKVVVTHHPFIPPPQDDGIKLVGRSSRALAVLDKCKVDVLLAGHLHHGYSGDVRPYYPKADRSIIGIQAGTAISNRIRQEPNAYNLISLQHREIVLQVREWNGQHFTPGLATRYVKDDQEWLRQE